MDANLLLFKPLGHVLGAFGDLRTVITGDSWGEIAVPVIQAFRMRLRGFIMAKARRIGLDLA